MHGGHFFVTDDELGDLPRILIKEMFYDPQQKVSA